MSFSEIEVLLNSFVQSDFNYCPLVQHSCASKSLYKIEIIQEQALRLLLNDFANDYAELLKKNQEKHNGNKTSKMPCTRNIQNCE